MNQFDEKLLRAFRENHLEHLLDDDKILKLRSFFELLVETNKTTNLTAITDENGVILKHFADCAVIANKIPTDYKVLDVGCGGGFPTIPLAILRPDLSVTGLDSTGKKVEFVKLAALKLVLDNVTPVCARAEEFVADKRESYDACVSRAVARLNVLMELCLPFVKIGGVFLAMKSNRGQEEYDEAKSGIQKLGGALSEVDALNLSFEGENAERELYVFDKKSHTPNAYPRKYAQILKKPL